MKMSYLQVIKLTIKENLWEDLWAQPMSCIM